MNPVLVIQHETRVRPGFCTQFLDSLSIPWQLICIEQRIALPDDIGRYSGLVSMGGSMSVNDDLPWIPDELALMKQAIARNIPVLGHCLGGQMLARALGGTVVDNAHKEIGWIDVKAEPVAAATTWLSADVHAFTAFQWHGQSFSIPDGAARILSNEYCRNQAFILGPHLGMQFHVEMTEQLVRDWCEADAMDIVNQHGPAIQPVDQILRDLSSKVAAQQRVASRLYSRWVQGLAA